MSFLDTQRILIAIQALSVKMDAYFLHLVMLMNAIDSRGVKALASLADIQQAVSDETTVEQAVVTLLNELSAELKAALAANDPVLAQQIVDQIQANSQALAGAVQANTAPPAPAQP